jgi:hypothetical protein
MPRTRSGASSTVVVVPFRITVMRPLPDVTLRLQRGRDGLDPPSRRTSDSVSFDFELRLASAEGEARLRWLGDCAQGTPADRFVYVNAGRQAGQASGCWDRRAKIKLAGITAQQVRATLSRADQRLEARFEGVGRDGGPSCATVPLLSGGWTVVRSAG